MRGHRKPVHKKIVCVCFGVLLLALGSPAHAQQPKKVPRIGYVAGFGNATDPGAPIQAFRQGLKERGYTEGSTIIVEYRADKVIK